MEDPRRLRWRCALSQPLATFASKVAIAAKGDDVLLAFATVLRLDTSRTRWKHRVPFYN